MFRKILFGNINSEFIHILPNLYRSKVDRFSHCYLHLTLNAMKMS